MKMNNRNNIHGSYTLSPSPNFLFNFAPLSYGITITYCNNTIAIILMFISQFTNLLHIYSFPHFFLQWQDEVSCSSYESTHVHQSQKQELTCTSHAHKFWVNAHYTHLKRVDESPFL
jgi:hypothetical protein